MESAAGSSCGKRISFENLLFKVGRNAKKGLLDFAGFTPTDALHVLGKLDKWDREASVAGAEIISGHISSAEKVAAEVYKKFVVLAALNIFKKSMLLSRSGSYLTKETERLS